MRLILLFILILSQSVAAQENVIDSLLTPFAGFDLASTYDAYATLFDMILYAILFVGLSQATLGKRFDSRGGKAVVSAIGISLAVALSLTQEALGFNLKAFGPLAAGIFIFFVGFVIFSGLRSMGLSASDSGSIALVVTYFSLRALSPSFIGFMAQTPSLSALHAIVLFAVLFGLYRIVRLVLPKHSQDTLSKTLQSYATTARDMKEQMQTERRERDFIKTRLNLVNKGSEQSSEEIIQHLNMIKGILHDYAQTGHGRDTLAKALQSLKTKSHSLMTLLERLEKETEKLSQFNYRHFNQLKKQWANLPEHARRHIRAVYHETWRKEKATEDLLDLENKAKKYQSLSIHAIDVLSAALRANRIDEAVTHLDQAITLERRALGMMKQAEEIEKRLERFVRNEERECKECVEFICK
jgi:hypothetical protein